MSTFTVECDDWGQAWTYLGQLLYGGAVPGVPTLYWSDFWQGEWFYVETDATGVILRGVTLDDTVILRSNTDEHSIGSTGLMEWYDVFTRVDFWYGVFLQPREPGLEWFLGGNPITSTAETLKEYLTLLDVNTGATLWTNLVDSYQTNFSGNIQYHQGVGCVRRLSTPAVTGDDVNLTLVSAPLHAVYATRNASSPYAVLGTADPWHPFWRYPWKGVSAQPFPLPYPDVLAVRALAVAIAEAGSLPGQVRQNGGRPLLSIGGPTPIELPPWDGTTNTALLSLALACQGFFAQGIVLPLRGGRRLILGGSALL